MNIGNAPAKSLRVKVGGPLKVLLVAHPPALVERMAEVVRSIEGARLVASFANATQAIDWLVWKPGEWQVAFVDLGLPQGASDEVIQRLLSEARPGTVVALGDHMWKEVREKCAAIGVYHLLEKGDLVALRAFIDEHAQ
jgi:DNA-binding NarL/FixJ family response regulator